MINAVECIIACDMCTAHTTQSHIVSSVFFFVSRSDSMQETERDVKCCGGIMKCNEKSIQNRRERKKMGQNGK